MCWWPDGTGEKKGKHGGIVLKTDKIVVESFGFLSYNLGRKPYRRLLWTTEEEETAEWRTLRMNR